MDPLWNKSRQELFGKRKSEVEHRHKAFTLIELLVVIAIIAVLMAILIPALHRVRYQTKRIVCAANLRSISQGMFSYAASYDNKMPKHYHFPASETYDTSTTAVNPWTSYIAATGSYRDAYGKLIPLQLGKLFTLRLVDDARSFYCPLGEKLKNSTYEGFTYSYYKDSEGELLPGNSVWAIPSWRPGDHIRASYMYWIHGQSNLDSLGRKTVVTDSIHKWDTIAHTTARGRPEGLNGLFGDGHVSFCTSQELFDEHLWGKDGSTNPGNDKEKFIEILRRIQP